MVPAPNAAEVFLLPLDPAQGLRRMLEDLGRFADLDPKVRAGVDLLDERFGGLTSDDQETLGPVLWVYVRRHVQHSGGLGVFRRWIGDGDRFLRTVEAALETAFSVESLKELARQSRQLAARDNFAAGGEIEQARRELGEVAPTTFSLPVLAFLAGVGAGTLAMAAADALTGPGPAPTPTPGPAVELEHPDPHP